MPTHIQCPSKKMCSYKFNQQSQQVIFLKYLGNPRKITVLKLFVKFAFVHTYVRVNCLCHCSEVRRSF